MVGMKTHMLNVARALGIGAMVALAGCGEGGEDPAAEMRRAQETPGGTAAPSGAPVVVASLAWDVPGTWGARPVDGVMRKAEFGLGVELFLRDAGFLQAEDVGAGFRQPVEETFARTRAQSVAVEGDDAHGTF